MANKRVLLGMSGGVDSSVAAVLLKEKGYDVVGITMKLYNGEFEGGCCNISSTLDAKRICDYIGAPHYTLDFTNEFRKYVIDDFIGEYSKCRTPNPCIECNKHLKFGIMYQKAQELGCDFISTGHYAKIAYSEKYGQNVLMKSAAQGKDQSYVLYNLPKELLDKVLFPLCDFENKAQIRAIAAEHKLPVASKPDSEDICFIPDGNYKKFLEENSDLKSREGNIVTRGGKILGKHTGLYKYTIGQRKGLGISNPVPLYVLGFNPAKNELTVGEENELYIKEFTVSDVNFLMFEKLSEPMHVKIKTRYSAKAYDGVISPAQSGVAVCFDEPQKSITPGQSAVFYVDDDIVLGGGKIDG
jgi:tRNA-specific 2-thiouridylase